MHGAFQHCEFCALTEEQRHLLHVFLASRGNTKELERYLGVSYPTARGRLDDLLATLGIDQRAVDSRERRRDVLRAVAEGTLDIDTAVGQLDK